ALDLFLGPPREIAIVGEPDDPRTGALVDEVVRERYLPNAVIAIGRPGDAAAAEAVPLLRDRTPVGGRPTAYVCERFACRMPVTSPEDLAGQLAPAGR
ncbi:MAG TPA: thioredoxin domain-containing protein, partial [Actinomycetota bacterium]|nr:thioredoxin domain-containing protein [Actinomycetota bacterium]